MQTHKEVVVQDEQLQQLLAFSVKTTASNSFLALVLAYMLADVLSWIVVLSWLFSILVTNLIRTMIGVYFVKHPVDDPKVVYWRLNVLRIGIVLSAMLWGICLIFTNGNGHFESEFFIAYMFIGLSAGAAVIYSIDLISAFAFIVFAVVPMLIGFAFSGNVTLIAMAVTGFSYILFLTTSISAFNKRLLEGVDLRLEAIKRTEEIKQLAFYDLLTGLPNRRLLTDRLSQALLTNQRRVKNGAVIFIDLDNFKTLNDTLGHNMGDMLLTQVAERLKECVRKSDTVARFGGDEFVLLLENLHKDDQIALAEIDQITQLIMASLNQPYQLASTEYKNTPSIGVAICGVNREHECTTEELLKHADIAMYQAKKGGRNRVCVFNQDMKKSLIHKC